MYQLSKVDKATRGLLIRMNQEITLHEFFSQAITRIPRNAPRFVRPDIVNDDPSHANWAYHCIADQHIHWINHPNALGHRYPNAAVREFGYVFWDYDRFTRVSFPQDVNEEASTFQATQSFHPEMLEVNYVSFPHIDMSRWASAEERLLGVTIPHKEMAKLKIAFGVIDPFERVGLEASHMWSEDDGPLDRDSIDMELEAGDSAKKTIIRERNYRSVPKAYVTYRPWVRR